jgi:5-methylcytosine-specific restriction endonuclease McrA
MRPLSTHQLLLWCAATDSTFVPTNVGGTPTLTGKCIHCRTKVSVSLHGRPIGGASLEHIVPRTHGGTDAFDNLAIACTRCNAQKGTRLDARRADDPTLRAVIETLRARREERLREPPDGLTLPPRPAR